MLADSLPHGAKNPFWAPAVQRVVSQRLIPGLHEKLVPAVEVMLTSPYIADLIGKGEFSGIKEAMGHSTEIGMCTFD